VYGVAGADAGAAAIVYTLVGKTFMPTMDEGDIIVGIEKLPSVSLEETAALDLKIHQALMKNIPEITGVVARAGSDEIGLDPMGLNQTDTFLVLKPRERMAGGEQGGADGQDPRRARPAAGRGYSFTQPIDMRVSEMIIGVRGDVAIKVFGPDLTTLNDLAGQIEKLIKRCRATRTSTRSRTTACSTCAWWSTGWPPDATACRLRTCRTRCACRSRASAPAR
jgi:cobalt-zinc-cadmium resistance protein CzcA